MMMMKRGKLRRLGIFLFEEIGVPKGWEKDCGKGFDDSRVAWRYIPGEGANGLENGQWRDEVVDRTEQQEDATAQFSNATTSTPVSGTSSRLARAHSEPTELNSARVRFTLVRTNSTYEIPRSLLETGNEDSTMIIDTSVPPPKPNTSAPAGTMYGLRPTVPEPQGAAGNDLEDFLVKREEEDRVGFMQTRAEAERVRQMEEGQKKKEAEERQKALNRTAERLALRGYGATNVSPPRTANPSCESVYASAQNTPAPEVVIKEEGKIKGTRITRKRSDK